MNVRWLEDGEENNIDFEVDNTQKKSDSEWKSLFEDMFDILKVTSKPDPIRSSCVESEHQSHDNISNEPNGNNCNESPFCKVDAVSWYQIGDCYETQKRHYFSSYTANEREFAFESCLEEGKNRTIDKPKERKYTGNTNTNKCNMTIVSREEECYEESDSDNCNATQASYRENISRDFSDFLFISFTCSSCYLSYRNGIEPHISYGCKY